MGKSCSNSYSDAPYPRRLAYEEHAKTASSCNLCRYYLLDVLFPSIRVFILFDNTHVSSLRRLLIMAAFYHNGSRRSIFAEHARQFGPISEPEMCQIDLLEWSPGTLFHVNIGRYAPFAILTCLTGDSASTQPLIETHAQAIPFRAQSRVQIVYVHPF